MEKYNNTSEFTLSATIRQDLDEIDTIIKESEEFSQRFKIQRYKEPPKSLFGKFAARFVRFNNRLKEIEEAETCPIRLLIFLVGSLFFIQIISYAYKNSAKQPESAHNIVVEAVVEK